MNVFVILGSLLRVAALRSTHGVRRRHFLLSIIGALATGTGNHRLPGSATGVSPTRAVFPGHCDGIAQPIATSYPAYSPTILSSSKNFNSRHRHVFKREYHRWPHARQAFVAAAASSCAVFVLMMLFTVLALVAG